jgi:hypothetical protein
MPAVFYNSSANINSLSVTNLTASALSAASTITGTVQSATLAGLNVSVSNTSQNVASLYLTNSNSMNFSLITAAGIGSIQATAVGQGSFNVSAGTNSRSVSRILLSDANGISFGLGTGASSNRITATYSDTLFGSYYAYPQGPNIMSSTVNLLGGSTNIVQPFNLPYGVSLSGGYGYIRLGVSNYVSGSTLTNTAALGAPNAGAGKVHRQGISVWANIYTLDTGANSSLLQQLTAFSLFSAIQFSYYWTAATNNSYTVDVTYGREGSTSSSRYNYSSNVSSIIFHNSVLSDFTGNRFLDIPVSGLGNMSLTQGPYWIAFQASSNSSTTNNMSSLTAFNTFSFYVNTQYASGWSPMNSAVTMLKLGHGFWTNTATGTTTSPLTISNIQTNASNVEIPFEIINRS